LRPGFGLKDLEDTIWGLGLGLGLGCPSLGLGLGLVNADFGLALA